VSFLAGLSPFHHCAAFGLSTALVLVCWVLRIYWLILLVRIILSWFPVPHSGPAGRLMSVLFQLTDPVMRPLRNIIPPVRAGMMAIDLSPILLFIGIGVLQRVIGC
jgi:YggT family protein